MTLSNRLAPKLLARHAQSLYRSRPIVGLCHSNQTTINQQNFINFSSNDYLGLSQSPRIHHSITTTLSSPGTVYGSGASHLVTGHHQAHHLLENELASWLGTERALLFSTGYMANLSVLQTLVEAQDVLLTDKLNHASLIEGAQASPAEVKRYPHNDMQALERRLVEVNKNNQQAMIVTDGVFSMDGDTADLPSIQKLAKKYQAWLLIDDAHGFGVLGKEGKGCFDYYQLAPDSNTLIMGTFGKAFGTFGAFVAGSEVAIESLIQFAKPYIYTTAMPVINAVATRTALNIVIHTPELRNKLERNIHYFKTQAQTVGLPLMPSNTAIQPLLIGTAEKAIEWSNALKDKGLWVTAIRPPTVPNNTARLRITLTADHTTEQIDQLINALDQLQQGTGDTQ